MLTEDKMPNADIQEAILAINAHFETINTDDIEMHWDRWADFGDRMRIETDERERNRFAFMFALVGTALEEMRELGYR